jgi:hypothetical protein
VGKVEQSEDNFWIDKLTEMFSNQFGQQILKDAIQECLGNQNNVQLFSKHKCADCGRTVFCPYPSRGDFQS